ncbi:MAG: 30S ribosomal protein S6 [Patescibacteria group bacterium]|nr:30S ribosomal protein S6 [Patescibacteria group bacterium]
MKDYTEYELIYIISIDDFEKIDSIREEVRQVIKDNGGEIVKESEPQKRKLAYPIKRKKSGAYLISRVLIEKDQIKQIKQQLEIKENILRHMFVLAENLPDSEKEEKAKIAKQEKKEVAGMAKEPEVVKPKMAETVKRELPEKEEGKESSVEKKSVEKKKEISMPEIEKTPVPPVTNKDALTEEIDSQLEKEPAETAEKTAEKETTKASISSPKDKLKLEELDKKIDDILKDDLI